MARFHINAKGEPGKCSAQSGNCPFGGDTDHYNSLDEAQSAFEKTMASETFTVVKNTDRPDFSAYTVRNVEAFDLSLAKSLETAQREYSSYSSSEEINKWISDKIDAVEENQKALDRAVPGTSDRTAAQENRRKVREELLAADLTVWKDSEFYNEGVEERMKENAVVIEDADNSIENALADAQGRKEIAKETGLSENDVENILVIVQKDYLRPRGAMTSSLTKLSENGNYVDDTAYVFRAKPTAVKAVLDFASRYSKVS